MWAYSVFFAQEEPVKYKYFAPEYVSLENEFELTNFVKFNSDSIFAFYNRLVIDRDFELDSVVLYTADSVFSIEYFQPETDEILKNVYEIKIDRNDSLIFRSPYLQILYFGRALNEGELKFHFKYKTVTFSDTLFKDSPLFINTESDKINIYRHSLYSEKAFKFTDKFEIQLTEKLPKENGVLNIWMKFLSDSHYPFVLVANDKTDSLMSFSITQAGLIKFEPTYRLLLWEDAFISRSVWNKFSLFFDANTDEIKLMINGKLIASISQANISFLRDVIFELKSGDNFVCVDELYYGIDSRENNSQIDRVHFIPSPNDSVKTVYSYSFDKYEVRNEDEEIRISFGNSNPEIIEGNLPIFSAAPELTMNYYNNYFELQWMSQNIEFAKEFIVQKSVDGNEFENMIVVEVDSDYTEKVYSFSDVRDINNQVVYYRIVQINKDNSEVYSNQLKVGLGEIEEFALDQNYPNPFNPVTNITLEVFVPGEYTISIYDLVGKKLAEIFQGNLNSGKHTFSFDGSELPSGIYFYEVISPSSSQVMKMILAK